MIKTQLEKLAQPYLLSVIVEDEEVVKKSLDQIWELKKSEFEIPGYKKGSAPREIVEKQLGMQVVYQHYIEALVDQVIEKNSDLEIIEVQGVYPVEIFPKVLIQVILYLKPTVELNYSNLILNKEEVVVTEEEVSFTLEKVRAAGATFEKVDKEVEFGDTIVFSFTGYINNKPFEGGSASKQQLDFNRGQFIPDFENAILGMKVGDLKAASVTFPENYKPEELSNKQATFDIAIHEVMKRVVPTLEEVCLKNNKNLDDWKNEIYNKLKDSKKNRQDQENKNQVMKQLQDRCVVSPIPQSLIEKQVSTLLERQARQANKTQEEFLQQLNLSLEDYNKINFENIKSSLKNGFILEEIAKVENIVASDEEVDELIKEEVLKYKMSYEKIKNTLDIEELKRQVVYKKVFDLLLSKE